MANDLIVHPAPAQHVDIERLADAVAKSGMFGIKTREQALVLMSIAQSEGRHPAEAARDYHVIGGRPAKTSEAMMRDFLKAGGRVEWHALTDEVADATFSHPAGGSVRILWDQPAVKRAGLQGREGHQKYPRAMLRARCVSEGVRTVYPAATSGAYVPEEVRDMPSLTEAVSTDATAALDEFAAAEPPPSRDVLAEARSASLGGTLRFREFWATLSAAERDGIREHLDAFHAAATTADDPFGLPPAETPAPAPRRARSAPPPATADAPPPLPAPEGIPGYRAVHGILRDSADDIAALTKVHHARADLGEIAVPLKNGKPDYRTWAVALFVPKVRSCTASNDLADLLGANEAHLERARAPGAMPAADLAEMERVIADQWPQLPADAIITDGLTQTGRI